MNTSMPNSLEKTGIDPIAGMQAGFRAAREEMSRS
jgi:hypothetical protein